MTPREKDSPTGSHSRLRQAPKAWALGAFLLGLVLTGWLTYTQQKQQSDALQQRFNSEVERVSRDIKRSFEMPIYGLMGARGVYAASDAVNRDEFLRYVNSRDLPGEFPGVRGMGFIERVQRVDLDAFTLRERADGMPDFNVRTSGTADDLFVIKFIEPLARNRAALGLDVGSEAMRREGAERAARTGKPAKTGVITLVQDQQSRPGFLVYVPVYRQNQPLNTPEERQAALLGMTYSPIVLEELMAANLDTLLLSGLHIALYDKPDSEGGQQLFSAGTDQVRPALQKDVSVMLSGTLLVLRARSTPAMEASANPWQAYYLGAAGLLLSTLLAWALWLLATGRARAEAKAKDMTADLQIAKDRIELAAESGEIGIWVFDVAQNNLHWDERMYRLYGLSAQPDFQPYQIWSESIHPEDRAAAELILEQALKGEREFDTEFRIVWPDRSVRHIRGTARVQRDEQGQPLRMVGVNFDLTEQHERERKLASNEVRLRAIYEILPVGISLTDPQGNIIDCNPASERMLGISKAEHLARAYDGKEWAINREDGSPMPVEEFASVRALARGVAVHEAVMQVVTDRHSVWLSVSAMPVRHEGFGVVIAYVDITEQKKQAGALLAAKSEAVQASQSKSQFLANMSHEIRTPMNAILGLLDLLQSTELTTRQIDYTSKTEGAARSLLGLLNDILDFSKVEAGKMTLENEPFRLDQALRNLSVVLSANVGSKDVEVLFDVDPTLPAMVRGDAMRLQQVLINLGGNAVKFTAHGQVVLALRKKAQTAQAVTIEFAMQDTGIGIAPENQAHIFTGFSQAEGSTTRRFGGTGLGLAISKRFVELMGGDIQISSALGVGTTFSFVVEFEVVEAAPAVAEQADLPAAAAQRVLVVDDNQVAGELMVRMARSWGWQADLAASGEEAIERVSAQAGAGAQSFPYPVIYMDWRMPGMDGWESTRQIRLLAERSHLPQPTVIMITAHGRDMLAQRTEDEQTLIDGFLVKPATASMLYDAWIEARCGNTGIRKLTKGRSGKRQLAGMRVLVVEDNLINQQVAEELLAAEGAIMFMAANGQLGVDAVASAAPQFDVVLMDVQMPVLDGYGATRAIREELKLKELPIIAMTANAMASDRDACLAAGMNEHIGKPFEMAKLVSLLIRMTGFQGDVALADTPDASSPSGPVAPAPDLPVPEVVGLDIQTALNRMSGMRSLYVRTAKDFVKIMDTAVPELQLCLDAGDNKQAMMRLHTLKGNAGTLGATAMAAEAAVLEKLCTTSAGMAECEAALAQFEVLLRDTQEKMRGAIAILGAEDAGKKPTKAKTSFTGVVGDAARQALQNIATLAKTANLDVLQVFAQAHELLGEFPSESIEALDEALQNLELETASTICDQMLLRAKG